MRKKAAVIISVIIAIVTLFSGCDALPFNAAENLIRPPRLSGEEGALQLAFEHAMAEKGEYVLQYPSAGEHKSAFVRTDCDGDGTEEAFVFYSLKAEEMIVNMYFLDNVRGEWKPVTTFPGEGTDVYSVEFSDLNNDGISEVLVGWSSLDAKTNKKLSVYSSDSVNELNYRVLAIESYTSMYTTDIDSDGEREILLALINSTSDTYTTDARLLKMISKGNETQISAVGQCSLYSEITAINAITSGREAGNRNGQRFIYIDETAGSSYLTEILCWDKKENALTCVLDVDMLNISSYPASRSLLLTCKDIDSDGEIEIPSTQLIAGSSVVKKLQSDAPAVSAENIYITNWKTYAYGEFETVSSYISNKYDGFDFKFDEQLMADWTVTFYPDDGITQFYAVPEQTESDEPAMNELILTIKTVSADTVMQPDMYLAETENMKYICEITRYGESLGWDTDKVSEHFSVIV